MKRSLGTLSALLVLLLAAACGDDTGEDTRADVPASSSPSSTPSSTPSPGGSESDAPAGTPVDFTEVALLSETNAGGEVSQQPTLLDSPAAVTSFAGTLDGRTMSAEIKAAVVKADVPEGQALVGTVVAIGCDVPPGVSVDWNGTGLDVTALKVKKPTPECFAPVTTVALLTVPAAAVTTS
jgi:hypothetical protein